MINRNETNRIVRTKELKNGTLVILSIQYQGEFLNQVKLCNTTLSEGEILSRECLLKKIRMMNLQRHDNKIEQWML